MIAWVVLAMLVVALRLGLRGRGRGRVRLRARDGARARARTAIPQPLTAHLREHHHDARQQPLAILDLRGRRMLHQTTDIEQCPTLHRRSTRDRVISRTVRRRGLATAFCDVERNRHRRAFELGAKLTPLARNAFEQTQRELQKIDRDAVDIEILVVERRPIGAHETRSTGAPPQLPAGAHAHVLAHPHEHGHGHETRTRPRARRRGAFCNRL